MTVDTVFPFLRWISINSAILIKERASPRHSVLHCFRYSLPDSISTCPVTQCVYSPSLRAHIHAHIHTYVRIHMYERYMQLVKTARDTLTHKEEGSQRLTTSSLLSNESRCRLRKSRKEFDVLVDGGSPITADGSALPYRMHTHSHAVFSSPLLFRCFSIFYCCLCDPPRCVGSRGESSSEERSLKSEGWCKFTDEMRGKCLRINNI